MNRPLKEDYEVDSDSGIMVRTFDYIAELEKYCNFIEYERLRCIETKNATVQMLEKNFTEYMKSFESYRELNRKTMESERKAYNKALDDVYELFKRGQITQESLQNLMK